MEIEIHSIVPYLILRGSCRGKTQEKKKKTVTEKCYIVSVGNKFKTEISSVSNIKSLRMTIMT